MQTESITETVDVAIIGGGAAGLMCAIEAGKRGRTVAVIEHADQIGKKILISGGGRCNFTNLKAGPSSFLSSNPHFCKSALARYTPADFIALVDKHRIKYHEKKDGQLFCDHRAHEITRMLEKECREAGVKVFLETRVSGIRHEGSFLVQTNRGEFRSSSLVIATGGLSIPKIGATAFGYDVARQFGLKLVEPIPGLVPLVMSESFLRVFGSLSGVSLDVRITCGNRSFDDAMLFTHRGLSGPSILQISSYWKPGSSLEIDLLKKGADGITRTPEERRYLSTLLGVLHPKKFAQCFCDHAFENKPVAQYSEREWNEILRVLRTWRVEPVTTEGFSKAEVTLGGVDTKELSSKTMEALNVPGLYFIGEVVDVTGHLGGFNFQWAWSSGYAAGQYA